MPAGKGTYGSKKGRPKKSKRCGIGKISDGKGGCRKMTAKEKKYLKGQVAGMAIGGAKLGSIAGGVSKKKNKADLASGVAGAIVGGIAGYRSAKKSIRTKKYKK